MSSLQCTKHARACSVTYLTASWELDKLGVEGSAIEGTSERSAYAAILDLSAYRNT